MLYSHLYIHVLEIDKAISILRWLQNVHVD